MEPTSRWTDNCSLDLPPKVRQPVNQTVRQYLVGLEQQSPVEGRCMSKTRCRPQIQISNVCDQGLHARPAGLLRQLSGGQSQLRDCGVQATAPRAVGRSPPFKSVWTPVNPPPFAVPHRSTVTNQDPEM